MTDLVGIKGDVRNSKLLLILLGILVLPVINSVESFLGTCYKIAGISLKKMAIFSLSFQVITIFILISAIFWMIKSRSQNNPKHTFVFTAKTFRILGVTSLLIIIVAMSLNALIGINYSESIDLSKITSGGLEPKDLANIAFISTGMHIARGIIFFGIYFIVAFRKTPSPF